MIPTFILVGGLTGLVAGIGALVWAAGSEAQERNELRQALRGVEAYGFNDQREVELLEPISARAVAPLADKILGYAKRLTPQAYQDEIGKRLRLAGYPDESLADPFLIARVTLPVICFFAIPMLLDFLNVSKSIPLSAISVPIGGGVIGYMLPDAWLNRKVEERQTEIRKTLPDLIDLLVISVEAGLGFEQALTRTVNSVPGALCEEFGRVLGEIKAGVSRRQALANLDERTNIDGIHSFVMAMRQADTFGVSVGRVLRQQADELRIMRRQIAQEAAMKAPVKLMVPMVFCVFPSLMAVVLGPAILNIINGLGT